MRVIVIGGMNLDLLGMVDTPLTARDSNPGRVISRRCSPPWAMTTGQRCCGMLAGGMGLICRSRYKPPAPRPAICAFMMKRAIWRWR